MQWFSGRPAAIAKLAGGQDAPMIRGSVKFYQQPGGVLVVADVSGLPGQDGFFGFHIHGGSACTGIGFSDTLSHYNSTEMPHPSHAGDLPPLLGCNGRAFLVVLTDRFSIRDIISRTVVIHSDPDDFTSQPAGNSGTKIGCGVIEKV